MTKAFDQIIGGLNDAIVYAESKKTGAVVH